MKERILILFFLILNYPNISFAQSTLSTQLDKRYGGALEEGVGTMIKTSDGGLMIGGFSGSGISGDKSDTCRGLWDYWVIKLDSLGIKQWDKTFGGTQREGSVSVKQTNDRGYILGGSSSSGIEGDKSEPSWGREDYWVIKIDSLGNKQWDKRFGGSGHDYLGQVDQTDDGGYFLSGESDSPISGNKTQASRGGIDYWVVRIDSLGNYIWDKRYGGTDDDEGPWDGGGISFAKCNDRGYLIGGWSQSGIGGDKSQAAWDLSGDFWIIKIDSAGNKLWDKRYGGTRYDALHKIIQTFDGGFILGGTTYSDISGNKTSANCTNFGVDGDYWLLKIDSVGNKLFDKDFGSEEADYFSDIYQTSDSGFVICGTNTFANASCQKSEGYIYSDNAWVVKTNSLGIKKWDKSIFGPNISNSTCVALPINNDCYAIASGSYSNMIGYNTQPSQGYSDYWLLKFCNCSPADLPNAAIGFASYSTEICPNESVKFVDVSGCYASRQWLFPGGSPTSSTSQIQTVCYPDSGFYPVTLISINDNGTDTLTQNNYIHVFPVPSQPTVTQTGDTLTSSPADFYQWYDSNWNPINGATNQTFIPDSSDYYFVCVQNIYGCDSCSDSLYYVTTGIEFLYGNAQSTIKIIPNPAKDKIKVELQNQLNQPQKIEIINTLGEIVLQQNNITTAKNSTEINIAAFSKGIYFLKLITDKGIGVVKFVKE